MRHLLSSVIDWTEDDFNKVIEAPLHQLVFDFMLWITKKHNLQTGEEMKKIVSDKYIDIYMCFEEIHDYIDETNQWNEFFSFATGLSLEQIESEIQSTEENFGIEQAQECIVNIAEQVLDIEDGSTIAVVEDGMGEYGMQVSMKYASNMVSIFSDSYPSRTITAINRAIKGIENLDIKSDANDYDDMDSFVQFDRVIVDNFAGGFSEGPDGGFNYGLIARFEGFPKDVSVSWNQCGVAIQMLKNHGRAVATLSAGQLSGKHAEMVRQFLIEKGYIEGVIALPEKLYVGTWINTYLLILGRDNHSVKLYDARDLYEKGRNKWKKVNTISDEYVGKIVDEYMNASGECIVVSKEDLRNNDYVLLPQRYVASHTTDNAITLDQYSKDVARGITLSAQQLDQLVVDEPTSCRCILPSSLANGIISGYKYFDIEKYGAKVNYAEEGDLLINKVGNPIRVAVSNDRYAVIGNIYILKKNQDIVSPYYVKCYLESPKGQKEISKYAAGNGSIMISVANVKKIEIPIYDDISQKQYNEECAEMTTQLQQAFNRLQEFENQF